MAVGGVLNKIMKRNIPTTEYDGFVYQEKGNRHNYFLDRVLMTGVTTILGVAGDTGGLQVWYGNLAAAKAFMTGTPTGFKESYEGVVKKFGKLTSEAARELDKLHPEFKEARLAAMAVRDTAADTGKDAHLLCEEFERGNDISKFSKEVQERAKPYLEWYKENVNKTHFVEKPVFSRSLFVGGTPDGGFGLKDGKNFINDKKFKNSIYSPQPHWQQAAYRMMIEEMSQDITTPVRLELKDGTIESYKNPQEYLGSLGGIKWDGSVILLLDGINGVQPMFRYAYEEDKNSFLASHTIYKAINNFKK